MAVHLTKIYTRTGDDGTTGLSDFSRVSKNDARLVAYADCDEANAAIGLANTLGGLDERVAAVLRTVQNDLFDAGADLATPIEENPKYPPLRIEQAYIDRLEAWIDEFNAELPDLTSFILPGGTPAGAYLHVARTVARRAERAAWAAHPPRPRRCCKRSTSTGCRTCCSCWAGSPTRRATSCGYPAANAEAGRSPIPDARRAPVSAGAVAGQGSAPIRRAALTASNRVWASSLRMTDRR